MDDRVVPLAHAVDEAAFGGKAVSLGAAIRAGLPVPPGAVIDTTAVNRVAEGNQAAIEMVRASCHIPDWRLAVRSSAVGEDSADASFAGQHVTKLNVRKAAVHEAVRLVWQSARTESALAYRARKGLSANPAIAAVVQMLIEPVAAGVLFTRNPMTGANERLIEASWGLGEAVVNGLIVPDRVRMSSAGGVLEFVAGDKDVKIWYGDDDGTIEVPVESSLRQTACIGDSHLAALHDLAERCARVWGPALDIEWALGGDDTIYLLQCRPITTLGGPDPVRST
jgi:pyruvate, water dikinase